MMTQTEPETHNAAAVAYETCVCNQQLKAMGPFSSCRSIIVPYPKGSIGPLTFSSAYDGDVNRQLTC